VPRRKKATPAPKRATKRATKTATPKRPREGSKADIAAQVEVLARARDHFESSKRFKGQLIVMDELDQTVPGYVSTGSLALDWIAGNNGGVPQSRVIDFSGDEGTGKSTAGDHLIAEFQRIGGHGVLWDVENARDHRYQKRVGVVRSRAAQLLSDTMEDGFEAMIELVSWANTHDPGRPGIIVWDTPAGTPTRAEADPDKTDERMGPAKIIRSHLRKLNQHLLAGRWVLCVINQTYMGTRPSGQAYKAVYGGGGIPFYSSVRYALSHPSPQWMGSDKEKGFPPIGQTVWVKNTKNRVGMPFRSRQIYIEFGIGIDNTWSVFQLLLESGAIRDKGSWYAFDADYCPDVAAIHPRSWQNKHWGLRDVITAHPEIWPRLIEMYLAAERQLEGRLGAVQAPYAPVHDADKDVENDAGSE
jgi:recombination protein RecA